MYVNVGNGQSLNARVGASTSDNIKYYIPHGQEVTVSGTSGSWSKVTVVGFSGKGSAWVQSSYLQSNNPNPLHNTKAYALGDKNLTTGSFGRYVHNLQIGLGITADGDFGPNTKMAVQSFQSSHGLTADGIAGPNTKTALWGSASATIIANGI